MRAKNSGIFSMSWSGVMFMSARDKGVRIEVLGEGEG